VIKTAWERLCWESIFPSRLDHYTQGAAEQQQSGLAQPKQQRQQLRDNRGWEGQDILALLMLLLLWLGRQLSKHLFNQLQLGLGLWGCPILLLLLLLLLLVLNAAVVRRILLLIKLMLRCWQGQRQQHELGCVLW
jgi:hypothetical protein